MRKSLEELKKDLVFKTESRGRKFEFHSTWGLFSPNRIDSGSAMLLEAVEPAPDSAILDLGCGYGALGIPLAASVPAGEVHMVDKDFTAVEYAKKNARSNGTGNCSIYLSDLFSHVPPGKKFDLIVSNVPAKAEREFYDILLLESRARLKKGGAICLVSISGLKEFFKKNLVEVFGNYEKLKQGGTYTVARAVKS